MTDKEKIEYWLREFGMPEENIENCATQIAQGYGACRYLDGVNDGAEAVKEQNIDAAMAEVEEKSKDFTAATKGESAEEILAEMRGEEPVSEDLEEEIDAEWNCYSKDGDVGCINKFSFILIARHFANWQKEQMMAKAVDGEVGYWNQRGLSVLMSLPREFEEDDKCKIILIKEE